MLERTVASSTSAQRRNALMRWPRAIFSYLGDPRFSYCAAIPEAFFEDPEGFRLAVAVHGSSRGAMAYRDSLRAFAERERCVVLAPLFPIGPLGDGNADGYKFLVEGDIRYDRIVLGMVAEIEADLGYAFGPFLLCGYSGGAQFAHRFFYLNPERIAGVSIGAPGAITRLDDAFDYWYGTRNWEAIFGSPIALDDLRNVPVQLVVGALDDQEIGFGKLRPTDEQIAKFGRNRKERITLLEENFRATGIPVTKVVVPDVAHEGLKTMSAVEAFFTGVLAQSVPPPIAEKEAR